MPSVNKHTLDAESSQFQRIFMFCHQLRAYIYNKHKIMNVKIQQQQKDQTLLISLAIQFLIIKKVKWMFLFDFYWCHLQSNH